VDVDLRQIFDLSDRFLEEVLPFEIEHRAQLHHPIGDLQ